MKPNRYGGTFKIAVTAAYIVMIVVNALANLLPLNGQTTGEVAAKYPNLFMPAPYTFAIWGLIYLLLGCYVLYQWGLFQKKKKTGEGRLRRLAYCVIVSSLANAAWIFAWHYERMFLSVLLMAVILIALIRATRVTLRERLTAKEKFFLRFPFQIYFGWITVAAIANVTVLLVAAGWNGFGLSPAFWTVAVLAAGALLGVAVILWDRDPAYGLVLLWAYTGILVRHVSVRGVANAYPAVTATLVICLILIAMVTVCPPLLHWWDRYTAHFNRQRQGRE